MAPETPSFQPLYASNQGLTQRLESGEGGPVKRSPASRTHAAQFSESAAIDELGERLAGENIVVRRRARAPLLQRTPRPRASMFRFLRMRRNDGQDEYPASDLFDVQARGRPPPKLLRAIDIKPGDGVLAAPFAALRWRTDVLDETTLPAALFKGLTKERFDAYEGSMQWLFRRPSSASACCAPRSR